MEKTKRALEAVQHIYLCEDEGMASGQPTKEDYLEARKLVAAALSELEGSASGNRDHISFAETAKDAHPELSEMIAFYIREGRVATLTGLEEFYQRAKKLEGSKPKEPPRYVMIKDRYGELYELLCNGGEALGRMRYPGGGPEGAMLHGPIEQAEYEEISYGSIAIKDWDHRQKAFLAECTRLQLEWISVEPPKDHPKEQGAEPVDYRSVLTTALAMDDDHIDRLLRDLRKVRPTTTAREKAMEEAIDKLLPLAQRIQAACEDGDVLNYDNEYDQRDAIEYEKVIAEAIAAKSTK